MAKPCKTVHVAMFPWFPSGHVNPFIHLSNQLAQQGFTISFLSTTSNMPKIKPFIRFPDQIHVVHLTPRPPVDNLLLSVQRSTADMASLKLNELMTSVDSVQDQVEAALRRLKPDIIVYDFIDYVPSVARALGIKSIFFGVTSATAIAYHMVPACSPAGRPPSEQDLTRPPPGFPDTGIFLNPHEARQLLFAYARFDGRSSLYDRVVMAMKEADAIMMKTCREMEAVYCDYISAQYSKPVLMSGPGLPESPPDTLDPRWATWLGRFEPGSVLFCSFGSADILAKEQIKELVLGLEETGAPFMAVLMFPTESMAESLPEGFTERVKDRAVIHSGWVQQQLILEHAAVGGYLCHSGFGSLAEAMAGDCQVVLLPLKGDQFLNARLMSRDLKVGVEVERRGGDGLFTKEDVCRAVRAVMVERDGEVGREVRENHAKLRGLLLREELQAAYMDEVVEKMRGLIK